MAGGDEEARTSENYATLQIGLHWATAALVALQVPLGGRMEEAFEAGAGLGAMSGMHVFAGLGLFVIAAWRLVLRAERGVPPAAGPVALARAGHAVHLALYALMLTVPVVGAVAWFRESEAAAALHGWLVAGLLGLIGLHVAAVLAHEARPPGVLSRMLRSRP